jgi:hypothetical protein
LSDIASIPNRTWAFSLVHDGWFRAYCAVQRTRREPWLRGEEDLIGGPWMVYFKHHLRSMDLAGIEEPHAIVTFTTERLAVQMSGVMPLQSRRWWLDAGDGNVKMQGF